MKDDEAGAGAAARLRKHAADCQGPRIGVCHSDCPYRRMPIASLIDDRKVLADAYLCEHSADEGEPIDEAWLRSGGFIDDGTMTVRLKHVVNGRQTELCTTLPHGGWFIGQNIREKILYVEIAAPQTRGQLRLLLRALGISIGGAGSTEGEGVGSGV